MTRKRYTKLLKSYGVTRNCAEMLAKISRERCGHYYFPYFEDDARGMLGVAAEFRRLRMAPSVTEGLMLATALHLKAPAVMRKKPKGA